MSDAAAFPTATTIKTRPAGRIVWKVDADICVAGAGISGISAALEAARLGRKVVLVDGLPALGGQAVNSIIGTFCRLFAHDVDRGKRYQFTYGIADEILGDLGASGDLFFRKGPGWTTVFYDEVALSRWISGDYHLTSDDVRQGTKFDDAVARTGWGFEVHDKLNKIYWENFEDGYVHYVPLRSMTPRDADNLVAALRHRLRDNLEGAKLRAEV